MIFLVRPSKTFLFNFLERKLKKYKGDIGLDVASAGFKNRRMFKTDFYYGLDLNLETLKKSIRKNESKNTFAIYADMIKLDKLPSGSVDVIVSTNTLYVLSSENRLKAIEHLCRLTAPEGKLLIEIPIDDSMNDMLSMINKDFGKVDVIYYKNIFSRLYEGIFERDGFLGAHPIAGKKPFLLMAFLISQLEYLFCKIKFINKHILIMASNKKTAEKNKFTLNHLPKIENKLFNAKL